MMDLPLRFVHIIVPIPQKNLINHSTIKGRKIFCSMCYFVVSAKQTSIQQPWHNKLSHLLCVLNNVISLFSSKESSKYNFVSLEIYDMQIITQWYNLHNFPSIFRHDVFERRNFLVGLSALIRVDLVFIRLVFGWIVKRVEGKK